MTGRGIMLGAAAVLLTAGCGGTRTAAQRTDIQSQVAQLDARLAALEQRQGTIEGKAWDQREDISYVRGRLDGVGGGVTAGAASTEKPSSKQIQAALKTAGFYTGSIDGKVGPKTRQAIRDFQAANGLKVDGKVGQQTWQQLARYTQ